MSQKLFTIYNAAQTVDVSFNPGSSIFPGSFSGGQGKWANVFRVDFYALDGSLVCVLPCDSSNSTISVDSTFIDFNLNFTSLLGRSNSSGFVGHLEIPQTEPVFMLGGVVLDGQPIVPTSTGATYVSIFAQLTSPQSGQETSTKIGASEVLSFNWPGFTFGETLIYRVRNVFPAGVSSPLPVFTVERAIPATDAFGLRRLPPPFAIPIALPTPGLALNSIALRAMQRPDDPWFRGTTASPGDWKIEVAQFQPGSIAEFWKSAVVDHYVGALQSVLNTAVISLLPTLQGSPVANSLNDADWRLLLPVSGQKGGPLSLQMLGPLGALPPSSQPVSVFCEGFLTHSGDSLAFDAQLVNVPPDAVPIAPWMSFQLTVATLIGDDDIRIGSIDIQLTQSNPSKPETQWGPWSCLVEFEGHGNLWLPRVGLSSLSAQGIPLVDVTPGGQDDPADPQLAAALAAASVAAGLQYDKIADSFARQTALVIPVTATNPVPRSLFLSFTENNSSNQQLTLTLSASAASTQNLDILVIDPNPFTVALARLPDLTSTASAETNQFAQWSNSFPEGAGWRISSGAGQFQLLLPPQGVGEAMLTGNPGEPDGTSPVDFRLSPPAQAVLQTSSQIQRYAEPGWNLRRVLGYPGERAPGAGVDSMQFEMLYGLVCNVVTSGLSLSEMFSRLGGFAGPLTDAPSGSLALGKPYHPVQKQWFDQLNTQWAALYQQLLARPGVLELWDQELGFDTALSNGISYELRAGANPLDGNQTPTFKGGVHYALALDELLESVTSNPQSSSATLFEPRFSAFGGSGKQRAGFDNDIVFVESDVSFGMVETLTITVIGRIANLWHKAKHVTVYERTVRPSRQFYLEQPLLNGRPLLRKTAEYIEILQKARSYPESGPAMTGFLQGGEFKTSRINVDSSWRIDVVDEGMASAGWMIPLWRRDAQPADIYPQPHVVLQLACDPASGASLRSAEITNPENLFFYTNPNQTTKDTDQWPAVQFVDFNLTEPARSVTPGSNLLDFPIEPGLGAFTYQVSAAATQIDVVSQRAANPMASTLSNVTFMRAQSGLSYPAVEVRAAGKLQDHVHNALGELKKAASSGKTSAQIVQRLQDPDLQSSVVAPFQTAVGQLNNFSDSSAYCAALASLAGNAFSSAAQPVSNVWGSLSTQLQQEILAAGSGIQATDDTLKQTLLSGVDTTFAGVQSLCGMVLADLSNVQALAQQASGGYSSIVNDLKNLEGRINAAASDTNWANCIVFLNRCQNDILAAISDVQQLLASVSYLFGNRAGANTALSPLSTDINQFLSSLGVAVQTALGDIQNKIQQQAIKDVQAIETLLSQNPLASDLTTLANTLQGAVGSVNQIAATVRSFRDQLRSAIDNVSTAVMDDYRKAVATVLENWPNFGNLLTAAETAVEAQVSGACTQFLGDLNALLSSILNPTAIKDYLDKTGGDLSAALDQLQTAYDNQLDGVVQRVRESLADTTNPVSNAVVLMRAFGNAPVVPGLSFNPPDVNLGQIAYFYTAVTDTGSNLFNEIVQNVPVSAGLTTAVDQANAVLPSLKQLGIQNLPASALLDRVIPDAGTLVKQSLAGIFPNLAGIDLGKLFSGILVPQVASNAIHISHHLDPQTLQAALDVVLDFPIENNEEVTLFSIGPATVTVQNCDFHAEVHVTGGVGQSVSETSLGSITADWTVYVGGTQILVFQHTALTFDQSGHLHFDIQPARVRLAAVLQFLADFLSGIGLGGGFSLNLVNDGHIECIQCVLSLPLPDLSGAVFGITNLALGCSFGLQYSPAFAIQIAANLGTQTAPFTLTVFILGGAGWFTSSFSYIPGTGQITADVSIGILASASLSISLGPLSGGVYLYFGITAEYHSAGGLNLGILIMLEGRVSLLGIIDADITLLLEAEYTTGGGLIGHGEVDVSIKICWCFTLDIHQSVNYTFGHSASTKVASARLAAVVAPSLATPPPDPTGVYAAAVNNRINYLS